MKIIDETLLDTFRGHRRCDWCKQLRYCVASHIYTRGAGRVDIPENLLSLCGVCESLHHSGHEPKTSTMETIVALRLGIQAEDIKKEVWRIRLLPQPKDSTPKPLKKREKKAPSSYQKAKKAMNDAWREHWKAKKKFIQEQAKREAQKPKNRGMS